MNVEIWKNVPGWETLYQVSDFGRVRSLSRRVSGGSGKTYLKQGRVLRTPPSGGYPQVNFSRDGVVTNLRVHVLVIETFRGPAPEGYQACHEDGNSMNPALTNLRWDSVTGNAADKKRHGTSSNGEKRPTAKLTDAAIREIRSSKDTQKSLAARFGVDPSAINKAKHGRTWKHV